MTEETLDILALADAALEDTEPFVENKDLLIGQAFAVTNLRKALPHLREYASKLSSGLLKTQHDLIETRERIRRIEGRLRLLTGGG